jgi:hypothetical protein
MLVHGSGLVMSLAAARLMLATDGQGPTPSVPDGGTTRAPSLSVPRPPPVRAPRTETYRLTPANDGSGDLIYQGSSFTARVGPDGRVTFKIKRVTDLGLLPLVPRNVYLGVPSLQSKLTATLGRRRPPPPTPTPQEEGPPPETTMLIPHVSRYRPDPREACRACTEPGGGMAFAVSGRFDLDDEVQLMSGADPHRVKKARFLAATRELRVQMAVRWHAANVRAATVKLPAQLESIACDRSLSVRDRRAILEALAVEMDAGTPEGHAAAITIRDLVASRFGHPDAGTPAGADPASQGCPDSGGAPAPAPAPPGR